MLVEILVLCWLKVKKKKVNDDYYFCSARIWLIQNHFWSHGFGIRLTVASIQVSSGWTRSKQSSPSHGNMLLDRTPQTPMFSSLRLASLRSTSNKSRSKANGVQMTSLCSRDRVAPPVGLGSSEWQQPGSGRCLNLEEKLPQRPPS